MPFTAPPTPSNWPLPLIAVLQRQHELVGQLADLCDRQAALVARGSTDQLLELLARRQGVIDEFTASQAQLTALTQDLDRRLESVSRDQRECVTALIGSIGERLAHVMRRDEEDQKLLRSSRDGVHLELKTIAAARQARSAYGAAAGPAAGGSPRRP